MNLSLSKISEDTFLRDVSHMVKTFFSGTDRPVTLTLGNSIEYYQVCSGDASGLTLTYFMARSNLIPYAFIWKKVKIMDFSDTIVVYDIKVGRCSQINEYMKL